MTRIARRFAIATGLVWAMTTGALAHHGRFWAETGQIEITGTIQEIYIGPPHPTLDIATADGTWHVELGNPRGTANAGFIEGVAIVGDEVTALGNRTTEPEELLMKAVRITVNSETYDIYPDRIQARS